jgi:anti-repressor protein
MNELTQVFEGKQVRIIEQEGDPWFVLKDVCDVLGLTNPSIVADRLDIDERSKFNLGRQGDGTIVNESGLYSVILRSDKPEAKRFRKWITSDVLPAIRKRGGYLSPAVDFTNPDNIQVMLDAWRADRDRLLAAKPAIESHAAMMRSDKTMSITQCAKHFGVHPKTEVFPYLRARGYLTSKDLPSQDALDADILALVETRDRYTDAIYPQAVVRVCQLEKWRTVVIPNIEKWKDE